MNNSSRSGPAPGNGATRRAGPRLRAALLVAALALPGTVVVVWAANQPGPTGGTPSAATVPDGTGSPTSGPTSAVVPPSGTATASAGPSKAPSPKSSAPAKDPAPVRPGNKTEKELAAIPQPVAAPVPLSEKKAVKSGITATITDLEAVAGEAKGIGEIAGPAVRFKVTVSNGTKAAVPLDTAVVNVSYGSSDIPSGKLSGPGATEFPLSVAPGGSASSVLVFAIPLDQRNDVRIYLNLDALTPIAVFEGQAPR